MAPIIIDITSSPESEESPNTVAKAALQSFQPRKRKSGLKDDVRGSSAQKRQKHVVSDGKQQIASSSGLTRARQTSAGEQLAGTVEDGSLATVLAQQARALPLEDREQLKSVDGSHGKRFFASSGDKWSGERSDRSQRIQRYQQFHAKEAFRRLSPVDATYAHNETSAAQTTANGAKSKGSLALSGQLSLGARGSPRAPALTGAGLSIIDDQASTQHDDQHGRLRGATTIASCLDPDIPRSSRKHQQIAQRLGAHGSRIEGAVDSASLELNLAYGQEPPRQPGLRFEDAGNLTLTGDGAAHVQPLTHTQQQIGRASDTAAPSSRANQPTATPVVRGTPYSDAENDLLLKLKRIDNLPWKEIVRYFNGRSQASLQVHYSNNLKNRPSKDASCSEKPKLRKLRRPSVTENVPTPPSTSDDHCAVPLRRRRQRNTGVSVVDGFVSWSQVANRLFEDDEPADATLEAGAEESPPNSLSKQDRTFPNPLSRVLRHRELGKGNGHGCASTTAIPDELKNHVFEDFRLRKSFASTCGDVTCLAWAANGKHFAAGSIAISDDRSMQYNSNLNLLLGDEEEGALQELAEHHVPRPLIDSTAANVNSFHAMRESQDPRLFMTVAAVGFSPDGKRLYTAGSDKKLRMYQVARSIENAECRYEIEHPASVDLLSVSNKTDVIATGCHQSSVGSVQVFRCGTQSYDQKLCLSPSLADSQSALPLYPSALRFGVASQHTNLLLVGFSSDSIEEERDTAGETALWNIETGQRIQLSTVTRNVFDVAWNPLPSSASTAFAVASTPGSGKVAASTRSIVQLYAPGQNRARQVLSWECPAFDINDLLYCPYDDSLIAAGATDGKVYVWDQRFADRSRKPLHVFQHGESLNVLDHDRDKEVADTGIRFLSWGATSSRLYSGSSDGVIKVWNPHRTTSSAHVQDVATFKTAVMSGAFSPDCRDLLIGEECGRINQLSVGYQDGDEEEQTRVVRKFGLFDAPGPVEQTASAIDAARELLDSKEIELKPMGDLPICQAVQGPKYAGPYLKPSAEEWAKAKDTYDQALNSQHDAHTRNNVPSSQSSDLQTALRDTQTAVQNAQHALEQIQSRHDASLEQELAADGTQGTFRFREWARSELEASLPYPAEPCKLDCNYLPKSVDDNSTVEVSHASEQRIPAALRLLPREALDVSELGCKELYEHGLAARCMFCSQTESSPARSLHLQMQCRQRCASIKANLRGKCAHCSAPTRGNDGQVKAQLCQRCNFACFRCAKPLELGANVVYCEPCDLAWRAGILGYELIE